MALGLAFLSDVIVVVDVVAILLDDEMKDCGNCG